MTLSAKHRCAVSTLLATAAIAASTLLKVNFIPMRELWLDETHSALLAQMPLAQLLTFVRGDVHPPLYFLLLSRWVAAVGASPTALRWFSLLANLLLLIPFVLLARRTLGPSITAFALALLLFSPALFVYSVEVRMYSMAALWVTAAAACLYPLMNGSGRRRNVLLFAGACVLAFYTHYADLFVIAGMLCLLAAAGGPHSSQRRAALVAGATICLLITPWVPTILQQRGRKVVMQHELEQSRAQPQYLSYSSQTPQPRPTLRHALGAVQDIGSLVGVYPARNRAVLGLLAMPFLIAMLTGVGLALRGDFLCRLALVAVGADVAGLLSQGVEARRYLIMLAPLLVLALAQSVREIGASTKVWRRAAAIAIGGAIMVSTVGGTIRIYERQYARPTIDLVEFLGRRVRPGELVVFDALYGEIPFEYYAQRVGFAPRTQGFPVSVRAWWASQPFKGWGGPLITRNDLGRFVDALVRQEAGQTVWLVLFETHYYDPREELSRELQLRGHADTTWQFTAGPLSGDQPVYRVLKARL